MNNKGWSGVKAAFVVALVAMLAACDNTPQEDFSSGEVDLTIDQARETFEQEGPGPEVAEKIEEAHEQAEQIIE